MIKNKEIIEREEAKFKHNKTLKKEENVNSLYKYVHKLLDSSANCVILNQTKYFEYRNPK